MWGERIQSTLQKRGWLLLCGAAVLLIGAILALEAIPLSRVSATPLAQGRLTPRVLAPSAPLAPVAALVAPQTFEALTPEQAVASNEAVAFSKGPNPPADPFTLATANAGDRQRALTCLAMAVYYEAGNQGEDGEAAVAQVVLNRVRHPIFPKTVCGVVFQGAELPTGCQFTFTCDGSLARKPSTAGWRQATDVAERALGGYVQRAVGEATHYHTIWVAPYWRSSVVKVAKIGAHIFYRLPGDLGEREAFDGRYGGVEAIPAVARGLATPPATLAAATDQPAAVTAVGSMPAGQTVQPVQVASLTIEPLIVGIAGPIDPPSDRRKGYFGRGGPDNQHLAAPGGW